MLGSVRLWPILLAVTLTTPLHAAEWQPTISTKTYAITGTTGAQLYASIGQKGPVISLGRRTIALTQWDLKWRRDYQPRGTSCVLASALPFVTITYTLPKPTQNLSGEVATKWARFAAGIKAHEKVHGDLVVQLTNNIINATVGLMVEDDAGCKKIREIVLDRVAAEFEIYKVDNREFEQREMSQGGNVQQLILALVNG